MDREEFVRHMFEYSALAGDIEDNIVHMLEYIGTNLEADRTYIFEKNTSGTSDNTYEWCAEDAVPQIDNLQNIKHDGLLDLWYRDFDDNRGIFITDLEEYREVSLPMYELLKVQDIHSLIAWPIYVDGCCIGFLGVDNPLRKHMEDVVRIFETVGYIMSIMIRQRDHAEMLRKLSYEDQLTGVKNRRELETFIQNEYPKVFSIGVLSCDLNGLKRINDTIGHEAGDRYIIKAAKNLVKIFGNDYVYRLGGDEFIAIEINVTDEEFEYKVRKVIEVMSENETYVATGFVYRSNNKTELYTLIGEADKKMYEDKERFYSDAKNERRRNPVKPLEKL